MGGGGDTDEARMESTEEEQLEVQEGETNVENAVKSGEQRGESVGDKHHNRLWVFLHKGAAFPSRR